MIDKDGVVRWSYRSPPAVIQGPTGFLEAPESLQHELTYAPLRQPFPSKIICKDQKTPCYPR